MSEVVLLKGSGGGFMYFKSMGINGQLKKGSSEAAASSVLGGIAMVFLLTRPVHTRTITNMGPIGLEMSAQGH
jgi:hypothetical protein